MVGAGDQRVDVYLHLNSRQILSSFAVHTFSQTLVFPPQRRIYAARRLALLIAEQRTAASFSCASGDHPASDRQYLD